jgi:hypothetical protein
MDYYGTPNFVQGTKKGCISDLNSAGQGQEEAAPQLVDASFHPYRHLEIQIARDSHSL